MSRRSTSRSPVTTRTAGQATRRVPVAKAVIEPPRSAAPPKLRASWLGYGLGALFAVTVVTQSRLHLWQREDTIKLANATGRFIVNREDYARRGQISTSDGKPLAFDQDVFELSVDFRKAPRTDGFFVALAEAAGVPATELALASAAGKRRLLWRDPLTESQAERANQVKSAWRADGVSLRRIQRRAYPLGAAASLVVGGWDDRGPLKGLESSQDRLLAGQDGFQEGMVDRTGAFLPMRMTGKTKARKDGRSIVLTLDSALQQVAFESIRRAVQENKAQRGVAIVLDPKTGDVLAAAQWPAFDPGAPGSAGQYDMAVTGAYEPGSTFKVLTLAKAIDMGLVRPQDVVHCTGELRLNAHWRIRCPDHHGVRAHGDVDGEKAIAKSCNVAAATWALKIGHANMTRFFDQLGLMAQPDLGLPNERPGSYNAGEYAKPLQLMQFGFGQSLQATPMALASAFASLANGGQRMAPRLIRKIGGAEQASRPMGAVVRPETAETMLRLMESVIETDAGTGAKLRIPGYRLAGKTGTAQKVGSGGGYVSNFVGFVPSREPKASILVMIDDPRGGRYYGGEVAGPVFDDLARAVIQRYHIPRGVTQ